MGTYTVVIEEVISQSYTLDAQTSEEAAAVAKARYDAGEYVLEPGELQDVRISVCDEFGEASDWESL